jgi:hypothetical protein
MNRRAFVTGLGAMLAAPRAAGAQPAGKLPRVGYVQAEILSATPLREAFLTGLRERGWNDGRNVAIATGAGATRRLPTWCGSTWMSWCYRIRTGSRPG